MHSEKHEKTLDFDRYLMLDSQEIRRGLVAWQRKLDSVLHAALAIYSPRDSKAARSLDPSDIRCLIISPTQKREDSYPKEHRMFKVATIQLRSWNVRSRTAGEIKSIAEYEGKHGTGINR